MCKIDSISGLELSVCVWTLPSRSQTNFSVSCHIEEGYDITVTRELCSAPLLNQQREPAREGVSRIVAKDEEHIYTVTWPHEPNQVGMYYVSIKKNGSDALQIPQNVGPVVSITAVRRPRLSLDIVICTVQGLYGYGRLEILSENRRILQLNSTAQGRYRLNRRTTKVGIRHENGTMMFTAEIPTSRTEKRYQCVFYPFSCQTVVGVSRPFVVNSHHVSTPILHIFHGSKRLERLGRVCCEVYGAHVKTLTWTRAVDCDAPPQLVTRFSPPPDLNYARTLVALPDTVSDVISTGSAWKPYMGFVLHCLERTWGDNETYMFKPIPPGEYQCIAEMAHDTLYEKSYHVQDKIYINVETTKQGPWECLRITCRFQKRTKGFFEIERMFDGEIVFTAELGDEFYSNPDSNVDLSVEGDTVTVNVTFQYDIMLEANFRCRISDSCAVDTSNTMSRVVSDAARNVFKATEPSTVSERTTQDSNLTEKTTIASIAPYRGLDRVLIKAERMNMRHTIAQRWNVCACAIAVITLMALHVKIWFD